MFKEKRSRWKVYTGHKTQERYGKYYRTFRTTQERKKWFDYLDQLYYNNLVLHKNRRSPSTLPNSWDDICRSSIYEHKRSWKSNTKCRKQWMKNL